MWDRFGWGPEQTDKLSLNRIRRIFAILEQQKVTRDKIENLGAPNPQKAEAILRQKNVEKIRLKQQKIVEEKDIGSSPEPEIPN